MDLSFYISLGTALLVAAVGILKVVAPKTATTVDDTVLSRLEALESLVEGLVGAKPAAPAAAEAPKAA